MKSDSMDAFVLLKQELAYTCLGAIREDVPFVVESDVSDYAIAGILPQERRPEAFMSRTLNACERRYPAMEQEATGIIESVQKWAHFFKARTFTLVTDQKSLSFMFDKGNHGKIKNNKIMIWGLELNQYDYEICHEPGQENIASDAFSRSCTTVDSTEKLQLLHDSLYNPGYTRLYHFVRARNLPYTSDETKSVC